MSHSDTERILPLTSMDNMDNIENMDIKGDMNAQYNKMRRLRAMLLHEDETGEEECDCSVNELEETTRKITLEHKPEISNKENCQNADLLKKWSLSIAEKDVQTRKGVSSARIVLNEDATLPTVPVAKTDSNGESASSEKGVELKDATYTVVTAIKSHIQKIASIVADPASWDSTQQLANVVRGTHTNLTDYAVEMFALVHILKFRAKVTGSLFIASNEIDFHKCLSEMMQCLQIPQVTISRESGFIDMDALVKQLEGMHKDILGLLKVCSTGERLRKQWFNIVATLYPKGDLEDDDNLVKHKLEKINELFQTSEQ